MFESDDTLFTFVVEYAKPAQFVSILGSWDNFRTPYALKQDVRCGRTTWRRYSDFQSITCDGDRIRSADDKRDGSLKMGGTYWYYYQIDNDLEYCDPSMPTTRTCPFLPGQEVNILEVPHQSGPIQPSNASSTSVNVYTLDPEEKYRSSSSPKSKVPPSPARPSSPKTLRSVVASWATGFSARKAIQQDAVMLASSSKISEKQPRSRDERVFTGLLSPSTDDHGNPVRQRPLRFRPCTAPQISANKDTVSLVPIRAIRTADASQYTSRPQSSKQRIRALIMSMPNLVSRKSPSKSFTSSSSSHLSNDLDDQRGWSGRSTSSSSQNNFIPLDFLSRPKLDSRPCSNLGSPLQLDFGELAGTDFASSFREAGLIETGVSESLGPTESSVDQPKPDCSTHQSNTVSTRSSFFLSLDSTNECTASSRSQPMTPERCNLKFEINVNERFQMSLGDKEACWFTLPGDNASVLTLQNVNKLPDDSSTAPRKFSTGGSHISSRRVEDWNQNVDHSKSAIEDLCEDMSYLSAIIQ